MLKTDESAFVLIDVQGKLANLMYKKERLFQNLQILTAGVRELGLPIIWAEQYPEGLGPTIPELREILSDDSPLPKKTFSVCGNPDLMQKIEHSGRREIIVAGIETHVCVYQTVADLIEKGFSVTIVADAISSRTKNNKRIGLRKMLELGARISSVEMLLFELMQTAEHEKFKVISKLVK